MQKTSRQKENEETVRNYEIAWFEPTWYLDHETKDFLKECVQNTHEKLILENEDLLQKLAAYGGEGINVKKILGVCLENGHLPVNIIQFLYAAISDMTSADSEGLMGNLLKGCESMLDQLFAANAGGQSSNVLAYTIIIFNRHSN